MKHSFAVIAALLFAACGGENSGREESNPIDETADSMHNAIDKAESVEVLLDDNKSAIDKALEEADPD